MKIIIDACSAILLSKASVVEVFSNENRVLLTTQTYNEIIKGKEKKFADAFIIERLYKNSIINSVDIKSKELFKKIKNDFGFWEGEASSITYALENKIPILTDNKQARKASKVYGLELVGSPEVVVSLFKTGKINKNKALHAVEILKKFGWFNDYIIEQVKEELK